MLRARLYMLLAISLTISACAVKVGGSQASVAPHQPEADQVAVSPEDIGGVVSGSNGLEAGVWVIAETDDQPTKFRKIVVTDEQGRFLVPDLPKGNYKVWVRGYGLVDSVPVNAVRGEKLRLSALPAPDARSAAKIYPPSYWLSLLHIPPPTAFPKSGAPQPARTQNNVEANLVFQAQSQTEVVYESRVCFACHQVGDKATRELNPELGTFDSTLAAWKRRVKSGQLGSSMEKYFSDAFPPQAGLGMFADWTDRIAAGEVPAAPPRPQGIERNVVLTEWDWGQGPGDWMHDDVATDKRNPTVNANGPVYGAAVGTGTLAVLDPKTNTVTHIEIPTRENPADMARTSWISSKDWKPSPFFGEKPVWTEPNHPHNGMLDQNGRLWVTTRIRRSDANPDFCKRGSSNAYAKNYPLTQSGRQAALYEPNTGKWTLIDTCFTTHHVQLAHDEDNTLYFSGDSNLVGWLDTKVFLATGDEQAAQGWCPAYVDVNGDGKFDPKTDISVEGPVYGIQINPVDGSVWYASPGLPGKIVRIERGSNPPATCRTEVYAPPFGNQKVPGKVSYGPKGIDFDRTGVAWTVLYSGQLASFARSKCSERSDPTAGGQQCPEGWSLYQLPGPKLNGAANGESADFAYYDWVDQFNTLGLGPNIPMAPGTNSDSLLVLQPETGKWLVFRVPYPMGFFSRGIDGRIDDPKAGWKGRGLWANSSDIPVWHQEGGAISKPFLVHFQLRPSPLAH